jgi:predicted O-methyltransferase YrrM
MDDPRWTAVDCYLAGLLGAQDDALASTLDANAQSGLPAIDVSPLLGKLLHLLARATGATQVLEIGTLGGYSAIWLGRALPAGGRLVALEADPRYAAVARANVGRAGLADVVEVRVGRALDTLPLLAEEGRGPFDMIFIDADKRSNAKYLEWALELSRPGTVIVADNVVRGGAVADDGDGDGDANVRGVRRFYELLAADPRVTATAIQTVGLKGYDGFAIALVTGGA